LYLTRYGFLPLFSEKFSWVEIYLKRRSSMYRRNVISVEGLFRSFTAADISADSIPHGYPDAT
jgi:hypothetical protein